MTNSFNCLRCGYSWIAIKQKPKVCPRCKSYYYDQEKRENRTGDEQMLVKGKPCPKCGKKTLSHPDNYYWSNWKDTNRAYCRSCGTRFKKKEREQSDNTAH